MGLTFLLASALDAASATLPLQHQGQLLTPSDSDMNAYQPGTGVADEPLLECMLRERCKAS